MNSKVNISSPPLILQPSCLEGTISIPSSKSQSIRAVLFGALAEGESQIEGLLDSADVQATVAACRTMGAKITTCGRDTQIQGVGGKIAFQTEKIDVGNSGLALRFLSGIAALGTTSLQITGDESVRTNRPMGDLIDGLEQLGAIIESKEGFAPICIRGPLRPGKATILGHDSQPVSALLVAAACSKGEFEIKVTHPGEKPWVDLTLHWLDRMKVSYTNRGHKLYRVKGDRVWGPFRYQVPGDLSSAAFPVVAALVTKSELNVKNVDLNDVQGDKRLFEILKEMGARISYCKENRELIVRKSKLRGASVDVNDCIDAVVALSVAACFAEGTTHILNAEVAREKECDRLHALTLELGKMGAEIEETKDGLIVQPARLYGASLDPHGDHRLAMGLAIAALGARGESQMTGIECIKKTYPHFIQDLKSVGANLERRNG